MRDHPLFGRSPRPLPPLGRCAALLHSTGARPGCLPRRRSLRRCCRRHSNATAAAAASCPTEDGVCVLGSGANASKKSVKQLGMAMDEDEEDMFAVRCCWAWPRSTYVDH